MILFYFRLFPNVKRFCFFSKKWITAHKKKQWRRSKDLKDK